MRAISSDPDGPCPPFSNSYPPFRERNLRRHLTNSCSFHLHVITRTTPRKNAIADCPRCLHQRERSTARCPRGSKRSVIPHWSIKACCWPAVWAIAVNMLERSTPRCLLVCRKMISHNRPKQIRHIREVVRDNCQIKLSYFYMAATYRAILGQGRLSGLRCWYDIYIANKKGFFFSARRSSMC